MLSRYKIILFGLALVLISLSGFTAQQKGGSVSRYWSSQGGFTPGLQINSQSKPQNSIGKFDFDSCVVSDPATGLAMGQCDSPLFSSPYAPVSAVGSASVEKFVQDVNSGAFKVKKKNASGTVTGNMRCESGCNVNRRMPSSGLNYALLFAWAGNQNVWFDLRATATGSQLKFKQYWSYLVLGGAYDHSEMSDGSVEIRNEQGETIAGPLTTSTPRSCQVTTQYQGFTEQHVPVMKVCPYREIAVSIPEYYVGQKIRVIWKLHTSNWGNVASSGFGGFEPAAAWSIDDIRFENPPRSPELACDKYETETGTSPNCRLTPAQGVSQQASSLYSFRVTQVDERGRAVSQPRAEITTNNFLQTSGNYVVDGICQGSTANTKKLYCGKTAKQANIVVGGPAPLAAFVSKDEVRIALPDNTDPANQFAGDTPVTVQLFKNDQPLAEIPYAQIKAQGYADHNVPTGTKYAYQIRYQSGRSGEISRKDTVVWDGSSVSLWTDHLPMPKTPMSILAKVKGVPSQPSSIYIARAPSVDPARPSTLGFTGDLNRRTFAPIEKINASRNGFAARAAWVTDPAGQDPQAEAADYNSPALPSTTDFFVLSGPDFASKKWTPKALQTILSGLGQVPGLKAEQCKFLGNQFQCESNIPSPVTMFRFPTVPADALRAMIAYHYGEVSEKGSTGGFLRCPECRMWLTGNSSAIFGGKINFMSVDPERDCPLGRFGESGYVRQCGANQSQSWSVAASLATFDAVKMAQLKPDIVSCLHGTACTDFTRSYWFKMLHDRYVGGALSAFTNLSPENNQRLADTFIMGLDAFTAPERRQIEAWTQSRDPMWDLLDSMSFYIPDFQNLHFENDSELLSKNASPGNSWMARLQDILDALIPNAYSIPLEGVDPVVSWNRVGKPFYENLNLKKAKLKALWLWVVRSLGSIEAMSRAVPPEECTNAFALIATPDCLQRTRENTPNLPLINVAQIEKALIEDIDSENLLSFYAWSYVPDAVMWIVSAPGIAKMLVNLKVAIQMRLSLTGRNILLQPAAVVDEQKNVVSAVTLAKDVGTGEARILSVANNGAMGNSPVVFPSGRVATTEEIAVSHGIEAIGDVQTVTAVAQNPTSQVLQNLVQARASGPAAMSEVAQCSPVGRAAFKQVLGNAEVRFKPDGTASIRYTEVRRELMAHPHHLYDNRGIFPNNVTNELTRAPRNTFGRVEPGHIGFRADRDGQSIEELRQYLRDVAFVEGAPGSPRIAGGMPLWNFMTLEPLCQPVRFLPGSRAVIGGIGGGPRPLGGWVSGTPRYRLALKFAKQAGLGFDRWNKGQYAVILRFRTGERSIVYGSYIDGRMSPTQPEFIFPHRIPNTDIFAADIVNTDNGFIMGDPIINPNYNGPQLEPVWYRNGDVLWEKPDIPY